MKGLFRTLLKASRTARKNQRTAVRTLRILAAAAKPPAPAKSRPAKKPARAKRTVTAPRPAPGRLLDDTFTHLGRTLHYKLYTPIGSARRRLPLLVMLHGCSQSAADFASGTAMNRLADAHGFLVLYPEQSRAFNVGLCWNWHRPIDQRRSGEPAFIAALTQHVTTICRANPARVYIAGISAGGTAAAIIGAAYPELYAAVGVHSGLARGSIRTLAGALAAMRNGVDPAADGGRRTLRLRPTIVFHGDQDRVVHPSHPRGFLLNLQASRSGAITSRTETGRSAGGRAFTRTRYAAATGGVLLEDWTVHGAGHAWSGGNAAGSHTDPSGPDASLAMVRFFLSHKI
ncbi:MAG TPA: PHB depolymerase family esterase [Xanthobacteraceae bacterium]|nr:PHB depolymerase family esterase [Xanthobacteraceae bacterium]